MLPYDIRETRSTENRPYGRKNIEAVIFTETCELWINIRNIPPPERYGNKKEDALLRRAPFFCDDSVIV